MKMARAGVVEYYGGIFASGKYVRVTNQVLSITPSSSHGLYDEDICRELLGVFLFEKAKLWLAGGFGFWFQSHQADSI